MRQQRASAAVVMPGYLQLYPDYGPGFFITTAFRWCLAPGKLRGQEDDMQPDESPKARPTPRLTNAEVNRRKGILGLLKNALAAERISSALVGRRTLVLRSDQGNGHPAGYGAMVRPSDPQLYVFAGEDVHVVTTDGEAYRFAGSHDYPTADPGGAARAYVLWRQLAEHGHAGRVSSRPL